MGGKGKKIYNLKRFIQKVKLLNTWQLILLLIPLFFIIATALRFDHIKMTELRSAVIAADKRGNDDEIASALNQLRDFAFSHIVINIIQKNGTEIVTFGTGPLYLEHQYRRHATSAIKAAEESIGSSENPNGNIFAKAMYVCKPQAIANNWAWNSKEYLSCMTGEISKYPASESVNDTIIAKIPSTSLYRYNFASPIWTPSFSGFCILIAILLIVVIFIRICIWCTLSIILIFLKKR